MTLLRNIWNWIMGLIFPKRNRVREPLITTLTRLGLRTDLKLCLDAGDAASYTSGQSWLDRSGSGYDFFRGPDGTATAADPTFNGNAGALSAAEYFSSDGGDYFKYDSANETWMESLHKDSAVFSFAGWVYINSIAATNPLLGNNRAVATPGCMSIIRTTGLIRFQIGNGTITQNFDSTIGVTVGAWNFIAVSVDEAANTIRYQINNTQETAACTYSSPSASNSSYTMEIGSIGANGSIASMPSGQRMASLAWWQGSTISAASMLSLFQATRGRFGV